MIIRDTCKSVVPGGSGDIAEGDDPLHGLLQVCPGRGEVHSLRFQRHFNDYLLIKDWQDW